MPLLRHLYELTIKPLRQKSRNLAKCLPKTTQTADFHFEASPVSPAIPGNNRQPREGETDMSFRQQVLALSTLPLILAILAIGFLVTSQSRHLAQNGIAAFEQTMLEAKQQELINYMNLARSSIQDIYDNAGPDDVAAQERVKEILTRLSYSEDGYFFVYDFQGNNLVHPKQPFRIGKNWIDLTDPDGDRVIENLIDVARAGGGFHPYKWEKPSSSEIADKLSYAIALPKWGWMVGTGLYVDDVMAQTAAADSELTSSINQTFVMIALITVPAVLAVFLTGLLLNLRERRMADTKLKELTQRIIDIQEQERTRIARELHDGISQNLIGVRYLLDLARHKVQEGAGDALATIERGACNLGKAIREVRRISHDLRPGMLDDLGLSAALKELTDNFAEHTGIEVDMKAVAFKNLLPDDAKTAIYRVAQEALTNVERHANATRVEIELTSGPDGLTMTISDNGKGLEAPPDSQNKHLLPGLGLRNMQERLEYFAGSLKLRSSAAGTTLVAKLPRSIYLSSSMDPGISTASQRARPELSDISQEQTAR